MLSKRIELSGQSFNRWTVISYVHNRQNHSFWLCRCDCGTVKEVSGNYLRSNKSKSCGCYDAELKRARSARNREMNPNRLKLASVHHSMMQRCYDRNHKQFHDYGGRGITVCKEWHAVSIFRNWANMNGYRPGLELNRINNSLGYFPENCNWVTKKQNANNKRNTRKFPAFGSSFTASEIAEYVGLPYEWVRNRLRRGSLTAEQILDMEQKSA